jgi:DNA modification methylase
MDEMTPYYGADGITIYHADCRDVFDEWEGLRTQSFDLGLTDPPYGIGFAARPMHRQRSWGMVSQGWDTPIDRSVLTSLRHISRFQIIWGGQYYAASLPESRCWLGWYKPDAPPSMGSLELAWTNLDRPPACIVRSISATNGERVRHPTQKPLAVVRWALSCVPDVQSVLDPFMGSGTALVAARERGYAAVGIDSHEEYCELAARRLSQMVLPLAYVEPVQLEMR